MEVTLKSELGDLHLGPNSDISWSYSLGQILLSCYISVF